MHESGSQFPQVLLGNGLNQGFGGESWSKAIESIWCNKAISREDVKSMPFPLQVVVGTDDQVDTALKRSPGFLYGLESLDRVRAPLESLLKLRFDHILTTNYSYELERVIASAVDRTGRACARFLAHTDGCRRAEPRYLLHTYHQMDYDGHTNRIWHIHGEARKPDSVVIGHYSYGRLLGKYTEELDRRRNSHYERQQEGKPAIIPSWLDAFILGDVYILGFGFDFSELDMWWLLNRKKREKAAHGRTVFYEPSYGKEAKHALLDTYGVEVRNLGFRTEHCNYLSFYEHAIEDIKHCAESAHKTSGEE